MKADRPNTTVVLIDLQYHDSFNAFEEFFGDHITYQEIEQRSYIEFKELIFAKINRDVKFRKYGRIGQVLTIKADMLDSEIEKFKRMLERNEIKLVYDWMVANVTIITDALPDFQCDEMDDDEKEEYEEFEDI